MRLLKAGASGAIGRRLVRRLKANQDEVLALTQSPDLKEIGSPPAHSEERRRSGRPLTALHAAAPEP